MREKLDSYKKALTSNKEDTEEITKLFSDAYKEIEELKEYIAKLEIDKKHLKNIRITSITFTGLGITSIVLANTLPIQNQRFKNFLNDFGIGVSVAGGISFIVSVVF